MCVFCFWLSGSGINFSRFSHIEAQSRFLYTDAGGGVILCFKGALQDTHPPGHTEHTTLIGWTVFYLSVEILSSRCFSPFFPLMFHVFFFSCCCCCWWWCSRGCLSLFRYWDKVRIQHSSTCAAFVRVADVGLFCLCSSTSWW